MFGYIKADTPNMYVKDTVLYKAMYCGLCKGIGKTCGQRARFVLNYDLTFLSVLLHNITNQDVKIENQRCAIHRLKKRPIAVVDNLTERIATLNVLLAYHKLNDDVIDNNKGRIKRSFFKSAYKKAIKNEPLMDVVIKKWYDKLLNLERTKCDSPDIVADPFGSMMQELIKVIIGEECDENLMELAYYLGKWIYLIDALDDFDKDIKNNNYNVFTLMYPQILSQNDLLLKYRQDIILIFASILNRINELTFKLDYKFNHDLIDNIFYKGLSVQTKKILERQKCKNTSKF